MAALAPFSGHTNNDRLFQDNRIPPRRMMDFKGIVKKKFGTGHGWQ
jgi:hypothetical protein